MKTELDAYNYQKWYLENFTYREGVWLLDIARLQIKGEHAISPRYIVAFNDVKYFQVYDETMHREKELIDRSDGVIGLHSKSNLIEYLKTNTKLIEFTPGQCNHYSVMTGNEFIHVITRSEPIITNIT